MFQNSKKENDNKIFKWMEVKPTNVFLDPWSFSPVAIGDSTCSTTFSDQDTKGGRQMQASELFPKDSCSSFFTLGVFFAFFARQSSPHTSGCSSPTRTFCSCRLVVQLPGEIKSWGTSKVITGSHGASPRCLSTTYQVMNLANSLPERLMANLAHKNWKSPGLFRSWRHFFQKTCFFEVDWATLTWRLLRRFHV